MPVPGATKSLNTPVIAISEMMCPEVLYHLSGHKCFECFNREEVLKGGLQSYFPKAPSYTRFVEFKPRMLTPLRCYLHLCSSGKVLGIHYGDCATLSACRPQRIPSHKVFKGKAERGKTTVGWFYGFKLFSVMNGLGERARAFATKGITADNNASVMRRLFRGLKGLAFADKGFINQKAAEDLLEGGLRLMTKLRTNVKNKLVEMNHKLLLRKRGVTESVIDILKTVCDIDHNHHRSRSTCWSTTTPPSSPTPPRREHPPPSYPDIPNSRYLPFPKPKRRTRQRQRRLQGKQMQQQVKI